MRADRNPAFLAFSIHGRTIANMHAPRSPWPLFLLAHLAGTMAVGSCSSDGYQAPAEERFLAVSDEEQQTLDRLVQHIDDAQTLLADGSLTREESDALEAAIDKARRSLDDYKKKRKQGQTRGVIMMGLGSASAGVAANDVTVVGIADDWVLVPIGIAALLTHAFADSRASTKELQNAWNDVGDDMLALGKTVESIAQALEQRALQAGMKPRPIAPPAHSERTTIDVSPPMPVPVPAPKEDPRKRREECKPKPVCTNRGDDDWHNYCADTVLGNEFPGCDVSINGRAFDAKRGDTLYEVKTHDYDTYADFLTDRVLEEHEATARSDILIARACGYRYEFVVGDAEHAAALTKRLAPLNVVRHEPKCNRKAHKAGKSNVKTP